jgi:hypothetical protein
MIEVDCHLLFNSFFSSVRVKIQCKDPTKILGERLFVFKSNVHLIIFTPEGYELAEVSEGDLTREMMIAKKWRTLWEMTYLLQ